MQYLIVTMVLFPGGCSPHLYLTGGMSEHPPEGKHRFPPNNLESCTLGVGHVSTGASAC